MPIFRYEAVQQDGKRITDTKEAVSREILLQEISSRGLVLLRWLDKESVVRTLSRGPKRILKNQGLLQLTADLANLMKSDLPVDRALLIVEESSVEASTKKTAAFLRKEIKQGKSLSDAMVLMPADFNNLYVNMVRAGELAGILPSVMEKLADLIEKSEDTKKFIISTSIYPSILLLTGFASILVILGFVVPSFADIFADLGQDLPLSTQVLLSISEFLRNWWWLMILCIALASTMIWRLAHSPEGKNMIDRNIFKIPSIGALVLDMQVSRFVRTLGTLVSSGVPLLKSLSVARDVVGNTMVREAAEDIYRQVKEGKNLARLVKEKGFFPPMVVQMVIIGDETGKTGEMLVAAAKDLDKKIEAKIAVFLSLLEPIAILMMGLIIGGVVISMLSTIFGINDISF